MGTRSGLLVVAASLSVILPGSYQFPQHVVFQPVTHQLTSMGEVDPDFSLVIPHYFRGSSEEPEVTSNQLICKKIQYGDDLSRFFPSTQASPLFFIPPTVLDPLSGSPFSKFFMAVPAVPSIGVIAASIPSKIAEAAFSPPPLMASMCVSSDSPRPFPVLFAPPPPSESSSFDYDSRKDMFTLPLEAPFHSTPISSLNNPLRVSLNTPSMGGVTLGLQGVPATIESISPSTDDPNGRILVKLHTNPPGSITLGFTGEGRMYRRPEELESDYRGEGLFTQAVAPSVSLVFSRPVGSIGIGAANSPAVNIEKQNIISSLRNSPTKTVLKDKTLYQAVLL